MDIRDRCAVLAREQVKNFLLSNKKAMVVGQTCLVDFSEHKPHENWAHYQTYKSVQDYHFH